MLGMRSVNNLDVTERNLLSYRRSLLIPGIDWTASRIPLCYLDPAVPNEKLSKIHLDELFPGNAKLEGDLLTIYKFCKNKQRQWFSLDDSSVGCERRSDGKKQDYLGIHLFLMFVENKDISTLQQGESAIRFLNLITVFGVEEWNESRLHTIFLKTYTSVLKGLFEKKSEHPLLVMKLWDKACVNDLTRVALFEVVRDKDHLEFMLQVANTTRFDFWGMRHGENDCIKEIISCYMWDRCDWISLLIDYGFKLENILPGKIGRELFYYSKFMGISYTIICPYNGPLPNIQMMWHLAVFCYRNGDVTLVPGFVDMFQKLFRSLVLPTVPHAIVRKCLQGVPAFPQTIDAHIEHFYECGVIHPIRCEEEVQPKLSHLCRRVVRERLARNFQLPAGINALNLPTFIKRFLRLEF